VNNPVPNISTLGMIIALAPTIIIVTLMHQWRMPTRETLYAVTRMLIQLLSIGYVLVFIFETSYLWIIISVLCFMLLIASHIAIRPLHNTSMKHYQAAFFALAIGSLPILSLIITFVVDITPWYNPRYLIPLAGMIFSAAMNAVSLAAERFQSEIFQGIDPIQARQLAFRAAMIPTLNSLHAVGLVALPGMMTGQILAGVSPFIAAKYQIVIMSMLLSVTGISAATYLSIQHTHPMRLNNSVEPH